MKTVFRKFPESLYLSDQLFTILIAILIGILGAFGAITFRLMIKFAHHVFFRTDSYTIEWIRSFPFWQRMLLPMVGGLLVGPIVYWFADEVRGSGIAEVIEAAAYHGGAIRKRVILAKLFAGAVTIGSGGSAGREGPIVQVGSSIGSALGQLLHVSGKKLRTFTACGAAAGIAATFNAPIAGALFAIEVILANFTVHQFSPIVIASVSATVISRYFLGRFPTFKIPTYHLVNSFEFLPYSVLGIAAGVLAVLFIKTMSFAQDLSDTVPLPDYLKPAVGGLAVGIIGVFIPQVYGVGYETTNDTLWGKNLGLFLLIIIVAKILATCATVGFGGSGGVFAPSLLLGSTLGAFIGDLFHSVYPTITAEPGAYALVGMAAVVSGVTHAPISSILIVFEMTNDYTILPPLMISCILSILTANYLYQKSMYTMKLTKKGVNVRREKDVHLLRQVLVHDVYTTDTATVFAQNSFEEAVKAVDQHPTSEVFVVNEKHELLGIVSFVKIRNLLLSNHEASVKSCAIDFTNFEIPVLFLNDNLDLVIQQFGKVNEDELPVVFSPGNRRLIGSVRLRDVIEAYNQELDHWDLTGGIHAILTSETRDRHLYLTDEICITEIELPDGFLGRSLKTIEVQKRYSIHILLIYKTRCPNHFSLDHTPLVIPTPDYVFSPGDKLVVIGPKKDLKWLQTM